MHTRSPQRSGRYNMGFDAVVHNGTLVTMDDRRPLIHNGWIGIRSGTIQAVEMATAQNPRPLAPLTIDAAGGIVMPGLVNAHTHLPMALFRGLADDLPLMEWLNDHIFPAEARFIQPASVRWGTLLSCAEMLLSGTTCCCGGYFLEDTVAQAVLESGLRAVLAQGVIDYPAPGVQDPSQNIAHATAYVKRWKDRSRLITPSVFCHAPYTCSDKTLLAAKAVASEQGLKFQVHVAETRMEKDQSLSEKGRTPVGHLDRLGVLDSDTLLSHCVWVNDKDMAVMARQGCAVVHCPESNMKLASGIAPVVQMQTAGIPVALGTDGCASNNNLDLFGEMGTAAKLHKLSTGDPTVLNATTVMKMATLEGARAIGLDNQIGSLEIGKQADLIVIDACAPHLTPIYHPASHIVYAAGGGDVQHVMVSGRQVVDNRRLLTLDVSTIMDRVNAIANEIQLQMGLNMD